MSNFWLHPDKFVAAYQPANIASELLGGLAPLVRQLPDGKYFQLLVPAHKVPLRTLETLHQLMGRHVGWRLVSIGESGQIAPAMNEAPIQWGALRQGDYSAAMAEGKKSSAESPPA